MFTDRRAGDVAWLWCAPKKALEDLEWKATRDISDMCRDMWRFQFRVKIDVINLRSRNSYEILKFKNVVILTQQQSMNPSGYVTDSSEEQESNMSSEISDDDFESKRSDSGLSSDEENATILPRLKFTMSPAKSIFHRQESNFLQKYLFILDIWTNWRVAKNTMAFRNSPSISKYIFFVKAQIKKDTL